ncbi:hypothetical protein D4764_0275540, partial [Takifugu flavidus]
MAPLSSSSSCANCAYLAVKIQELEQRISTLYQIQEAERFIDTIVFKEPHPDSADASDPDITAPNTTVTTTSPPAVHPLISPDASSTKHAAGPRANLKPRANSTPSQQEQWSQIGARTGKTKRPSQAPLFHLHLENKFTPLDHHDSPPLPALSRTLSIRLSDGTGSFPSSSSRLPPPAPVPDHPIPGPLQRRSLSSTTPAPQLRPSLSPNTTSILVHSLLPTSSPEPHLPTTSPPSYNNSTGFKFTFQIQYKILLLTFRAIHKLPLLTCLTSSTLPFQHAPSDPPPPSTSLCPLSTSEKWTIGCCIRGLIECLQSSNDSTGCFEDDRRSNTSREPAQSARNGEESQPYLMADLPAACLRLFKLPFYSTGFDCFGPYLVKVGHRNEKRWGLIFKCLTTRCVHLDLINSLDTGTFLLAPRRFIARRGTPSEIYSDQGTNFRGAERELKEAFADMEPQLQKSSASHQIIFRFNPLASPHFGGIWEREIRSVKRALQVVIGAQAVPENVLLTVLIEVEGILNAKPLGYVSSDVADPDPVTPSMLLMGRRDASLPQVSYVPDAITRRRWRQNQMIADHFWSRFIKGYLPTLQVRQKWRIPTSNLEIGTVVMIVDPQLQRAQWPVGKIVNLNVSEDGYIRAAEVK